MRSFDQYTDKYFLRSRTILNELDLNPWVLARVFVRKQCNIYGLSHAAKHIAMYSHNARIWSLKDGELVNPSETVMEIMAPIQEIIALETVYLGLISARTTEENGGKEPNLKIVTDTCSRIKEMIGNRPLIYMGARHWHWAMDAALSRAAFDGGASSCSTDNGAEAIGQQGTGTIPHALENVFAFYHGMDYAVAGATAAFDEVIDEDIPRIALVDFNNKEVDDAIICKHEIKNLYGVRIDTCGENMMQGAMWDKDKYMGGQGVTITGVASVNRALENNQEERPVKVILSSGFANPDKVEAFVNAEKEYGRLFDGLGAGQLWDGISATMDIVGMAEFDYDVEGKKLKPGQFEPVSKVGRYRIVNERLRRIL